MAGEHEHHVTPGRRDALEGTCRGAPLDDRVKPGEQLLAALAHHHCPVAQLRPAGQRGPHRRGLELRIRPRKLAQPAGLAQQAVLAPSREHPRHETGRAGSVLHALGGHPAILCAFRGHPAILRTLGGHPVHIALG